MPLSKTNSSALILPAPDTNGVAGTNASTLDIRPVKAPVPIPSGWTWLAWLLGLLILAVVLWYAWKKLHRPKTVVTLQRLFPPHVRARQKLEEALALIDQPRPFCIAVSDALRGYLEERFQLKAPERTTEEFLDELQSSQALSPDHKSVLREFLTRCDLVKFARHEPLFRDLQELHASALRLVSETEPVSDLPDLGQHVGQAAPPAP